MRPYSSYSSRVTSSNSRRYRDDQDEITPARSAAAGFLRDLLSSTSTTGTTNSDDPPPSSMRPPQPTHPPFHPPSLEARGSFDRDDYYMGRPHPGQSEPRMRYHPHYGPPPQRMYPSAGRHADYADPSALPHGGSWEDRGSWEERGSWDDRRPAARYPAGPPPPPPPQRWDDAHRPQPHLSSLPNPPASMSRPDQAWKASSFDSQRPSEESTDFRPADDSRQGRKDVRYVFGSPSKPRRSTSPPQSQREHVLPVAAGKEENTSKITCTCKKSKCLKLYCQCFAGKMMCNSECRCLVCFNTPQHEQARRDAIKTILSRNPSAFDTKFKPMISTKLEEGSDAAPVAHKVGCKCRKSACLKKYCECYNAQVKCSISCKCVGCQNVPPGGLGQKRSSENRSVDTEEDESAKDAAQHLAFLKHDSSPEKSEASEADIRIIARPDRLSIPSLPTETLSGDDDESASSSSKYPRPSAASSARLEAEESLDDESPKPGTKDGPATNNLLMAAYAMTSLHTGGSQPSTPSKASEPSGESRKRKSSSGSEAEVSSNRSAGVSNSKGPTNSPTLSEGNSNERKHLDGKPSENSSSNGKSTDAKVISPNDELNSQKKRRIGGDDNDDVGKQVSNDDSSSNSSPSTRQSCLV